MTITIISDLGNKSPYTGWAESIIRTQLPNANLIVITHELPPFRLIQDAYIWRCSIKNYPRNTFHISLTDLVMSIPTQLLITQINESYLLGIDNGLLTTTSSNEETDYYILPKVASNFSEFIEQCVEAIKALNEKKSLNDNFLQYQPQKIYDFPKVIDHGNFLECLIIFIDGYENVVTNLTREEFESKRGGRDYNITFLRNESIGKIHDYFKDADTGGIVAYFNDFGYLQISMRNKNNRTASMLGLSLYQNESLINNYIRIEFL